MREIKFRAWDNEQRRMVFDFETIPYFDSRVITKYSIKNCMQYTGLKDKNGVEVYEGDILAYTDKDGKHNGAFQCNWGERSCGCCTTIIGYDIGHDTDYEAMTVIGNIYENPGLVERIKSDA